LGLGGDGDGDKKEEEEEKDYFGKNDIIGDIGMMNLNPGFT